MRRFNHNRVFHFRADEALFEQAANAAQRDGMNISAFVRAALRRAVQEAA